MRWRPGRLGVLMAALVATGCGEPKFQFAPVEGTVTRDGKPLPNVLVTFFPDPEAGTLGPRSTGLTDRAGRYRLTAGPTQTGAVVGRHRVGLLDANLLGGPGGGAEGPSEVEDGAKGPRPSGPRVPESHNEFRNTPLRAEVTDGGSVVDFALPK
ncbi:hypothetical protein R5W24_005032 [Gemmata sp. JC717]|uniref:hypothetical protein n=1 Tax=Gemmata algarum TaxID=2975278 RepID=UPI0021BA3BFF|nr:hypothetical protein [Gemmata algarum]MDY3555886.1 hypothetical protein [Gemmata algarum]